MGALEGLRVLDFSRVLAGPLCTMYLGDLGADVIKIEHPQGGDDTRGWGPPFVGEDAAYFLCLNRNKRSVALDLSTPRGRKDAQALAAGSDVLLENYRPGLMRNWDLDYKALRPANPGLIYCSLHAFRDENDTRPGYDLTLQALSGLMSLTGPKDGEPVKVGVALLDVIAGLNAAIGVLAALHHRQRTGEGQMVEVSLLDASVAALVNQAANFLLGGVVPERMGNEHPNIVPYQVFQAADRPFVLAAANDRLFARTCEVISRPDLAEEERFRTNSGRVENRADLLPLLVEAFRTNSADHWLKALEEAGVPCGPVRTLDEVFSSPEGSQMVDAVVDPTRGALRLVASPIRLSADPPETRLPPPKLGEHTEEVLAELAPSSEDNS
jgi:crotonobetainyl-CoA:carnitine CoA-transferase CaiB-like acyl-CoA transferase